MFICIKYLILIREWHKEAQKPIPDFLNEIINKCGSCYALLSCSNKQFPLFNGATEIYYKDYDIFLKNLKYKFVNKNYEIANLIKIKKKNLNFSLIVEILHLTFLQNIIRPDAYHLSLFRINKKLYVIQDMENTYLQDFHQ